MNKNIEELKRANQGYTKQNAWTKLQIALCYIIPILEGFEKRLKRIETGLGIYTEEEIKEIKVGGTDPD